MLFSYLWNIIIIPFSIWQCAALISVLPFTYTYDITIVNHPEISPFAKLTNNIINRGTTQGKHSKALSARYTAFLFLTNNMSRPVCLPAGMICVLVEQLCPNIIQKVPVQIIIYIDYTRECIQKVLKWPLSSKTFVYPNFPESPGFLFSFLKEECWKCSWFLGRLETNPGEKKGFPLFFKKVNQMKSSTNDSYCKYK